MNDILLPSQLLDIGFKYSVNTHPYMDLYTLPGVGRVYFFPKRKFFAAYKSRVRIRINTLQDIKNQINMPTVEQNELDYNWKLLQQLAALHDANDFDGIQKLVEDSIWSLTAQHYEIILMAVKLLPEFIEKYRNFLYRLYYDCQVTSSDMDWSTYLRFETMHDMLKASKP